MPESAQTPYDAIGGELAVRKLVDTFYRHMDELPEAYGIRKLHPPDLAGSAQKLFMFLSGWLGGPQLFVQRFGHPRLRARHLPFPIGPSERDQWLHCMHLAMQECIADQAIREGLFRALSDLADHMRNTSTLQHPPQG
ncbi:MAG: group II truncated hemoglobin [Rhodocyclaceae bacterium]|nr:group II truncated hemoglobin [Rhodocyclaceae bacterium]MBX3669336.1 group II truncated hemoglobin [Rhodocyclaceae bacterium]